MLIILVISYVFSIFKKRADKPKLINHLKLLLITVTFTVIIVPSIYKINSYYKSLNIISSTEKASEKNHAKEKYDKENEETFNTRISETFKVSYLDNSKENGRMAIIKYGMKKWQESPIIGKGFSSFLSASSFLNPNEEAKAKGLEYADNQYITILVETGTIGFMSLAITYFILFFKQIKQKKYISILASIVIAFFGLFINILEVQLIAFMYFMLIGLEMNQPYTRKRIINDKN